MRIRQFVTRIMAIYIGHIGEFNEIAEDFESVVERMD